MTNFPEQFVSAVVVYCCLDTRFYSLVRQQHGRWAIPLEPKCLDIQFALSMFLLVPPFLIGEPRNFVHNILIAGILLDESVNIAPTLHELSLAIDHVHRASPMGGYNLLADCDD